MYAERKTKKKHQEEKERKKLKKKTPDYKNILTYTYDTPNSVNQQE